MFVNYFSEFKEAIELTQRKKRCVPIGIYGSFKRENIVYLYKLRDYLRDNNYFSLMSLDLQRCCRRPPRMSEEEYNYKLTRIMTQINHIHIFFFFKENERDHNVNQSASIELGVLENMGERHVRIFYEKGYLEQSSSPFRGMLSNRKNEWPEDSFERRTDDKNNIVNYDFILRTGLSFCYDRIFSDPTLGYASREEFNKILSEVCKNEMIIDK
jgi:hypothetical protein